MVFVKKEKGKIMDSNTQKATNSVMKATGVLVITAFLSRIIGYVRNIVITSTFGLGIDTDAYYAAFTIPDMIYYCLVGGALSSAFIPVFSGYIAKKENEEGYKMASTILNMVAILAAALCVLGVIFAPELVDVLVQFEGEAYTLTVLLTRIMFAQSFFMCITGIAHGILQSYKHFTTPAVGAVLYNITIICVGLILAKVFNLGIMGFSIGVVCGAIMNLAIQIPKLKYYKFKYMFILDLHHEGVKQFFKLLVPVLLGLSMNELNLLANQYFGSGIGDSVLSALKSAQQIMMLPVGIFGAAIGLSIFPTMTEHFANEEYDKYKSDISMSLRNVLFVVVPCTAGLIVLRTPVIRAMYKQGNFTEENVKIVATILIFYSLGIVGYSAQQILNRAFYSSKDTKTPVNINIFILLLNIMLSFFFVKLWAAEGLALAYATSGTVSMIMLGLFLHKKIGSFNGKEIVESAVKIVIATAIMSVALFFLNMILESYLPVGRKLFQIVEVLIELTVGVGIYCVVAVVLKMDEMKMVLGMLKRKIKR